MAENFLSSSYQQMIGTVSDTDKEIERIYRRAAEELAKKADKAKFRGITRRWQLEMEKSLKARMRQIGSEVENVITQAAQSVSLLPVQATADWLDRVLTAAMGKGTDRSFAGTLARTSDEALRQVISGRAYLDGKSLSKRIWSRIGRQEEGINNALKQAIAQHKSARELARELSQYLNPAARDSPDASYYAKRLARTSINHAYALANREAQARNPFCKAMHWQLSSRHGAQMTDICDEYASHDEGLGPGNWPVKDTPLGHACCLCSQYPVVDKSLEECGKELRRWLEGEPNERLETAFGAWRAENRLQKMGARTTMMADDHTAEKRKDAQRRIAERADVGAMNPATREAFFNELADYSQGNLELVAQGKLPTDGKTVIPDGKLTYGLVLDPNKARRFAECLKLGDGDQMWVRQQISDHVARQEYQMRIGLTDQYGTRYTSIMTLEGRNDLHHEVYVPWVMDSQKHGELRLTSLYIKE